MFRTTVLLLVFVISIEMGVTKGSRGKPHKFRPKHNGTRHSVNKIDTEGEHGEIVLSSLANEYVNSLQESAYILNQAVQTSGEDKHYQNKLKEISSDVTDVTFAVQKEIHGHPRQLRYQIKASTVFFTLLLPEISELIQSHDNVTFANSLVRESVDNTIYAIETLEARTDLHDKTNSELFKEIDATFEKVTAILNNTKAEDPEVVEELIIQTLHLNHAIDRVVNKLEVWLHSNSGSDANTKIVEEVSENLAVLAADLRKESNVGATGSQLISKIQNGVKAAETEIEKLAKVEQEAKDGQEHVADIFRNILYDGVAIANTFLIQLQMIARMNTD